MKQEKAKRKYMKPHFEVYEFSRQPHLLQTSANMDVTYEEEDWT